MNDTTAIEDITKLIEDLYLQDPGLAEILELWKISKKEYEELTLCLGRKSGNALNSSTINSEFNGNNSGTTFGQI